MGGARPVGCLHVALAQRGIVEATSDGDLGAAGVGFDRIVLSSDPASCGAVLSDGIIVASVWAPNLGVSLSKFKDKKTAVSRGRLLLATSGNWGRAVGAGRDRREQLGAPGIRTRGCAIPPERMARQKSAMQSVAALEKNG